MTQRDQADPLAGSILGVIMRNYSLLEIIDAYSHFNYKFFKNGAYNLNIFGIRAPYRDAGKYDDIIGVIYKELENKNFILKTWPATTDPGRYYLKKPMNKQGTAILAPGQYRSAYKLGKHRGRYQALIQSKQVTVYRDNNRDYTLDNKNTDTGFFGINIHHSGNNKSDDIGLNSAGCQVFQYKKDFLEFMNIIVKATNIWGPVFTYTLFQDNGLIKCH